MESKEGQTLKLPVPSKILLVVLEYLYRDEASDVSSSEDPEFVGNVLVVADQFLMTRLVQLCYCTTYIK